MRAYRRAFVSTSVPIASLMLFYGLTNPARRTRRMIKRSALVIASMAATASALGEKPKVGEAIHNVVDGAGNVLQGAASHLENKADQFVDTAGNLYSVLKDTTGAATGLVMDAAGAVWDVTKIGGSFIINGIMSYPGDVMNSAKASAEDMRAMMGGLPDLASQLAGAAYKPSLPPMKEMLHPGSWMAAGHENWVKGKDSLNQLTAAFSAPYNRFEDEHCTPATLVPSVKEPTKIYMPGFIMDIKMGECVIANDAVLADCLFSHDCPKEALQIDCIKPYLEYAHIPGAVIYKHHTPVEFKTKECKIEKEHGVEEELVLYEFTEHNVDLKAIADQVSNTFGNAVGQLANTATNLAQDVAGFVSKKDATEKADFDAFVAKYSGMA